MNIDQRTLLLRRNIKIKILIKVKSIINLIKNTLTKSNVNFRITKQYSMLYNLINYTDDNAIKNQFFKLSTLFLLYIYIIISSC